MFRAWSLDSPFVSTWGHQLPGRQNEQSQVLLRGPEARPASVPCPCSPLKVFHSAHVTYLLSPNTNT